MPARLTVGPTEEPVSLDEAKNQLRLETNADDDRVGALITAARQYVEERCWRGLTQQTWELVLDGFWMPSTLELPYTRGRVDSPIKLQMGGLAELAEDAPAVTSVKYIDENGVERTLATTEYSIDNVSAPARILPAFGKSWPSTRRQWDAVRITYVVGWTIDDIPEPLKQAVLLALTEMYEKRTPEIGEMPAVVALISPYQLNQVG
jgi:hypothetical protein